MKKILLINSYSDNNKGDLGIILGTIHNIKKVDKSCQINAISSFSNGDIYFNTEHEELKKYINKIYPTIFGRVFQRNIFLKFLNVLNGIFFDIFITFSNKIIFRFYCKLFFKQIYDVVNESDIIVSKGGSFLCNKPYLVDKLRLHRELLIFKFCQKLDKPVFIFGQSIGPVYGYFSKKNLISVLKKNKLNILRERQCVSEYPEIFESLSNIIFGHDLAFSLNSNVKKSRSIDEIINIGITVKTFDTDEKNKKYMDLIVNLISYINKHYKCKFHFIPHVTIDDDIIQSNLIFSKLDNNLKSKCFVDKNNYTIDELLSIYRDKSLLIGTRLHSTIFSLVVNTPVINIGYHGTKAKGVFADCQLQDYQFEINDDKFLIQKSIKKLLENNFDFSKKLDEIKLDNLRMTKKIINS